MRNPAIDVCIQLPILTQPVHLLHG